MRFRCGSDVPPSSLVVLFEPNIKTAHLLTYIRSRNGVLGYPTDIGLPTQLLPRLYIEQLNGKHAVSVCVFYNSCRSSIIMCRQACLIGRAADSGDYHLQLSTQSYMWNRPVLGIGHKMNGAFILVLGDVNHELGPRVLPHEDYSSVDDPRRGRCESTICDTTNLGLLADAAMSISLP